MYSLFLYYLTPWTIKLICKEQVESRYKIQLFYLWQNLIHSVQRQITNDKTADNLAYTLCRTVFQTEYEIDGVFKKLDIALKSPKQTHQIYRQGPEKW